MSIFNGPVAFKPRYETFSDVQLLDEDGRQAALV
jgi:hypothetical protein